MKCPESSPESSAEGKLFHLKASPEKEHSPTAFKCPAKVSTVLFSAKDNINNKENNNTSSSKEHDRTVDEYLEDSGYLSLHNSQIDWHHGDDEDVQKKAVVAAAVSSLAGKSEWSPSKCKENQRSRHSLSLSASTPVDGLKTRTTTLSSTPSDERRSPSLPILRFQQEVCEELSKSYKKNKRPDLDIIKKVAQRYPLDRVIGRHMGLDHVDMLSYLLSMNMKITLTYILALLGDMDLISCKKVSKTWRKIICEDAAACGRCLRAEEAALESRNCVTHRARGLTRDVAVSRMVLSCMQSMASSSSSSASPLSPGQSCRMSKRTTPSQRGKGTECTRFDDFVQAASGLKNHESLRHCGRCGSPATHFPEAQRAECTRSSCLYSFCSRCRESFHGSNPCRTVEPRSSFSSKAVLPGSTRSKRNVRRL